MNIESISSIKEAEEFCKINFTDSSPFLKYNFFKLLEDSNCTNSSSGWIPQHITIKDKGKPLGLSPTLKN